MLARLQVPVATGSGELRQRSFFAAPYAFLKKERIISGTENRCHYGK